MIYVPRSPEENKAMAGWACKVIGVESFRDYQCLGFIVHKKMACVVVAYDWAPPNCFVSIASVNPRWAVRKNFAALFDWLFVQLKCERVTGIVARRNKRARKLNEGLGFRIEGTHPKMLPDGGTVITYGLLKHDAQTRLARMLKNGPVLEAESTRAA